MWSGRSVECRFMDLQHSRVMALFHSDSNPPLVFYSDPVMYDPAMRATLHWSLKKQETSAKKISKKHNIDITK